MAYDPVAIARAEAAQLAGQKLVEAGLDVAVSYWDFDADAEAWSLCIVLAQPRDPIAFIKLMFELERRGALPPYLEAGDLRQRVHPDPRALALVTLSKVRRGIVHVKQTMLDGHYFEEAILGYVSPGLAASRPAA